LTVDETLWALVEQRAALTPELFALVDEQDGAVTFADQRDRAECVAAGLADLGIDSTARVSWQLRTWIESFVLVVALSRLGALKNPMLPI
jgi:non-ribosomal peptide synthetase component E (peptide arylation enzyme)